VNWEHIKATEQEAVVDHGWPTAGSAGLGAGRQTAGPAGHSGLTVPPPAPDTDNPTAAFGAELLDIVRRADAAGVNAEQALRETVLAYRNEIRRAELVDERPTGPDD
jgi:XTP/dITP diphosphohydrolase